MAAMVNEGALILQEGIAEDADAIDVVKMLGYGFPRWRGGPMFWARETGLGTVRDAMARVRRPVAGVVARRRHAALNPVIADRPLLGILLMLGFCALAPLGDSVAKILGGAIPLLQLVLVRFAMQAALLIPLIAAQGGTLAMTPRVLRLTALRTVLHILGVGAMFTALRYLPLADAIAIAFVMPFIMLLLGWLVLGEEVGPRRLAACAVGFAGTLMVIQPSFAAVGPLALLPVGWR
jgi:hypothetical protein